MGRIRRHLTYANVLSLIVIVVATSGSAYAAKKRLYTGKDIKDSSLTGVDFRNGSLMRADIANTSFNAMRGRRGATGDAGATGGVGPKGETGDAGAMGKEAHSLVRYAWFSSPYLIDGTGSGGVDWDQAGAFNTDSYPSADYLPVKINENEPVILQLTGNNHGTTGTIRPTSSGLLTATATITLIHHHDSEDASHANGLDLHGRVRCQLRYANNGAAISASSPKLGAAEWMSTRRAHKLTTLTLTGSEKITATTTSNYNVGISCADVDRTGSDQWEFVAGNLTAHAVYVGP